MLWITLDHDFKMFKILNISLNLNQNFQESRTIYTLKHVRGWQDLSTALGHILMLCPVLGRQKVLQDNKHNLTQKLSTVLLNFQIFF